VASVFKRAGSGGVVAPATTGGITLVLTVFTTPAAGQVTAVATLLTAPVVTVTASVPAEAIGATGSVAPATTD
jgi:hypothetical protein